MVANVQRAMVICMVGLRCWKYVYMSLTTLQGVLCPLGLEELIQLTCKSIVHAPGRCSDRKVCESGDSVQEPYLVAHHVLLAHASAANVYNREYRKLQAGKLSIGLNMDWAEPQDPHNIKDVSGGFPSHGVSAWLYAFYVPLLSLLEYVTVYLHLCYPSSSIQCFLST